MSEQQEQDKYAEIGAILKKEREARGISLEMVHDATKIPMDALRAIEEGYTIRTLSSFYLKGFLKIYAKYLNVDISDMLGSRESLNYIKEHSSLSSEEDDNISLQWLHDMVSAVKPIHIGILIAIIVCWIIISGIYRFFVHKKETIQQKDVTVVTDIKQIQTKGLEHINKVYRRKKDRKQNKKDNVKKVSGQTEYKARRDLRHTKDKKSKNVHNKRHKFTKRMSANVVRTVMPKSVHTKPPVVHKQEKNIVLTVRAKKKSWLQVKVDGEVVFQSNLRMGAVETWLADDKIEISGKNINQLEFELNGKMIGALGRKDRRARRVIITKDGLSVTR